MSIEIEQIISFGNFGLILDMVGVCILYKYGLPENINREGHSFLALEDSNINEINKAKKYDRWSKFGLSLLVIGFSFQLIGNIIKAI